jgi:deazaflavin-dependent oxidoreductase (nitroreductase family)
LSYLLEAEAMPQTTPGDPRDGGQHRPEAGRAERSSQAGGRRPVRTYRMSLGRRVGDAIISALIRAGVVPSSYLLTTRGRKTGRLRTNPVTIVESNGRRWLVAPYGPVSWVHNARAAGRVTLHRRRETLECEVREVTPEEAGPVLKQYVAISRPTRPYFQAAKDAPVEEFIGEAGRHPVFELTPVQ